MAAAVVVERNLGGRPLKFPTVESLSYQIDRYFNSISYDEQAINEIGDPILDREGNHIVKINYVSPPSVLGLCLFLDIDRVTLADYQSKEGFSCTIQKAKTKIEQYLADQLHRPTQVAGIIFNLKNNFGWKDTQNIEVTGAEGGPLQVQGISALSDTDLKLMIEIMERAQIQGEVVDIESSDE